MALTKLMLHSGELWYYPQTLSMKSYPFVYVNYLGSNDHNRQREAFWCAGTVETTGIQRIQVVPAEEWHPDRPPRHPTSPTGGGRHVGRGGSDAADLQRTVCGADQEGFNGHKQIWSGSEVVKAQLRTQR